MLALIFIKYKAGQGGSTTTGDIADIYPMDSPEIVGTETLNYFFPVKMDLIIPCGSQFRIEENRKQWDCINCPYNDPASCDVIKFTSPKFNAGDIGQEPVIELKRKYKVNIDNILSVKSKILVEKQGKTQEEQSLVISRADKNPQLKTILEKKSVIAVK